VRIVSLVPSLTELAVHLGRGDDLVGVTRFCIRPRASAIAPGSRLSAARRPRPSTGSSPDGPDLVLANREENERENGRGVAGRRRRGARDGRPDGGRRGAGDPGGGGAPRSPRAGPGAGPPHRRGARGGPEGGGRTRRAATPRPRLARPVDGRRPGHVSLLAPRGGRRPERRRRPRAALPRAERRGAPRRRAGSRPAPLRALPLRRRAFAGDRGARVAGRPGRRGAPHLVRPRTPDGLRHAAHLLAQL
jgi:hypothetical protein